MTPSEIEQKHEAQVIRAMYRAVRELAKLNKQSRRLGVWEGTTKRAYAELHQALSKAEIRFATRDATAV